MPRKYTPPKQELKPDFRYDSLLVSRFINELMSDGEKSLAQRIVYDALDIVGDRTNEPPLEMMEQAISNVRPTLDVRPRRVGGATYQVPVEVSSGRQGSLARKWLLDAARNRPGHSMAARLANELMDAARGEGAAVRRKEETHRRAQANRAFAHYRW